MADLLPWNKLANLQLTAQAKDHAVLRILDLPRVTHEFASWRLPSAGLVRFIDERANLGC